MKIKIALVALCAFLVVGCASVQMESIEESNKAKAFDPPSEGKSGLYIYRSGGPGTILKKDIFVNDRCIGESAPNVFFYQEVSGGEQHKISTESEFSPNDLFVDTVSGENYFIKQYIKMGVFVGGANLKLVDQEQGKRDVSKLMMATKGNCSK